MEGFLQILLLNSLIIVTFLLGLAALVCWFKFTVAITLRTMFGFLFLSFVLTGSCMLMCHFMFSGIYFNNQEELLQLFRSLI